MAKSIHQLQEKNPDGRNQILPLRVSLPTNVSEEGEELRLRPRLASGCRMVSLVFLFVAGVFFYLPFTLGDGLAVWVICFLMGLFVLTMTLWVLNTDRAWIFEKDTIGSRSLLGRSEHSVEEIRCIELVEQGLFGPRPQYGHGVYVHPERGASIDLGGGSPRTARQIGEKLAEFYGVELKDRTRPEAATEFRKHHGRLFVIALVLGLLLVFLMLKFSS